MNPLFRTPIRQSSNNIRVFPTQMDTQSLGNLRVQCTTAGIAPIPNATVQIRSSSEPDKVIEELTTDISGLTPEIQLPAPNVDYSLAPGTMQPYAEYNILATAEGFNSTSIAEMNILANVTALQGATLTPQSAATQDSLYVIPPHTLFGDYPPKIAEAEIKSTSETGEIVLEKVVIPEFVIVHDGPPTDTSAQNHYVRFRDYIKNVASSEIYATWPEESIRANILAILSFTLNRVYTEWYRNQGYNFTITSSTAFDHKWMNGRNIYDTISVIVDEIFNNYLSRPNVKQPILTQYCDGERVTCPNWLSQWGSKTLGDQGMSSIEILRYYYGDTIFINTAPEVSGVPASWPGSNLTIGSSGDSVRTIQEQLNTISNTYTAIPKVSANGQFTQQTADAVKKFQEIFNMPVSGIVDFPTWYRISAIYVAVTRIGEG